MDNLTTIKQVTHATDSNFQQLISEGWVLLHVYSETTGGRTAVYYVMGHESPIEEKESKYKEVMDKITSMNKEN